MSTAASELSPPQKDGGDASGDMQSCGSGKDCIGVPITHILEIVGKARPQPVPLAPGFVGGMVHYRGDVLTTVSLRQLLGLAAQGWAPGHPGAGKLKRVAWTAGGFGGRGADGVVCGV